MINTLEALISDPKWKAYVELINEEIKRSERMAIESIGNDIPNKDAYFRAKYLKEAISMPTTKIQASKMNKNKTSLNG